VTGPQGDTGTAATITVGSVIDGTTASVTNVGNSSTAIFNFVIPIGLQGPSGPKGDTGTLEVSLISISNTITNTLTNVTALRFDSDSGFDLVNLGGGAAKIQLNSTFKFWNVDGNPGLIAEGLDTINLIASTGTGILAITSGTSKSLTFSIKPASTSTIGGIKVGNNLTITEDGTLNANETTGVIKNFNILGEFWSPVAGTAAFFVTNQTDLKSVNLTNGSGPVQEDLMAELYRNGALISFYTLPAGSQNIWINTPVTTLYTNDRMTVNMVAGRGNNFTMSLLNVEKQY
jgi:hypothetical protein